uniref:phosphoenolpyruvate carboxylase n=1 Tax=Janibacter melonis TaxID=262209 RepID=UPI002096057B
MYQSWPFFRSFLDNVAMTLAKTDLGIARQYVAALAPDGEGTLGDIAAELDRTVAEVLRVTGDAALLDREPTLRTTLEIREHYLQPLHHLQVDLLRRQRDGEDDPRLGRALLHTVSGIAAGCATRGEPTGEPGSFAHLHHRPAYPPVRGVITHVRVGRRVLGGCG